MITMESNKHPKRYLVIPQILLYMILILFFIAATLALLLVIVDDSDLQSKILKAEYVILFIQGISSMIAFVKVVLKNSITVSEWGDIFIHSFKISLLNYIMVPSADALRQGLILRQQREQGASYRKYNLRSY